MSTKNKVNSATYKNMPPANPDFWNWQEKALCRNTDPDLFFYADLEKGEDKQKRIKAAIAICGNCPVIYQCRQFALDTKQDYGIWGGLTQEELAKLRRVKPRED
jgi:WhiB family transcriptional regulator, redox-sensing transcriptional regulator